jgi:HD-like signal output (HDOD) protein
MSDAEEQILQTIREGRFLPSIPAVAIEVLRQARDPRVSIERLAETIERDPALAAKLLRYANSSYYAGTQPIVSLPQAVVRLGVRSTKLLALSFSLTDAVGHDLRDFDFNAFWQRSLTTAVTARRLARHSVRSLADEAFLVGLLADVGSPVLARAFPQRYRSVSASFLRSPQDLPDIELKILGVAHPLVGRRLAEAWHLPADLCQALGAHHDLAALPRDGRAFDLAVVTAIAAVFADIVVRGSSEPRVNQLVRLFHDHFALRTAHLTAMLKGIDREIEDIADMLAVTLPAAHGLHAEAKVEMLRLAMTPADATEAAGPKTPKDQ